MDLLDTMFRQSSNLQLHFTLTIHGIHAESEQQFYKAAK